MSYQNMLLDKKGSVATITLNRPEILNALSMKLREELLSAFKEVRDNSSIRVLIITGRGRAFCAGADLRELQALTAGQVPPGIMELATNRVLGLVEMGKPTIAAINGVAAGGGFSLAMTCDIRLMAQSARLVSTFTKRGLVPDGGLTYTLTQIIGAARAAELIFCAETVDAQQAEKLGLTNWVVPDGELMDAAMSLALKIAQNAPLALAASKEAIYLALKGNLKTSLDFEGHSQLEIFQTKDFKEGILSFLEKREPIYHGE
ncbi:MAG: enoyl-CoA hydratase-related protein [Dehalococcoidia bacterium]|nr:enoyl-CoA hydratase-related protein [Dehalococcoidia bacterium]